MSLKSSLLNLSIPQATPKGLKINAVHRLIEWDTIKATIFVKKHGLPYLIVQTDGRSYWVPLYLGDFEKFKTQILTSTTVDNPVHQAIKVFRGPTQSQVYLGSLIVIGIWLFILFLLFGTAYQQLSST